MLALASLLALSALGGRKATSRVEDAGDAALAMDSPMIAEIDFQSIDGDAVYATRRSCGNPPPDRSHQRPR
jgi:hypothetical protein